VINRFDFCDRDVELQGELIEIPSRRANLSPRYEDEVIPFAFGGSDLIRDTSHGSDSAVRFDGSRHRHATDDAVPSKDRKKPDRHGRSGTGPVRTGRRVGGVIDRDLAGVGNGGSVVHRVAKRRMKGAQSGSQDAHPLIPPL
jgi:hypothetical protein